MKLQNERWASGSCTVNFAVTLVTYFLNSFSQFTGDDANLCVDEKRSNCFSDRTYAPIFSAPPLLQSSENFHCWWKMFVSCSGQSLKWITRVIIRVKVNSSNTFCDSSLAFSKVTLVWKFFSCGNAERHAKIDRGAIDLATVAWNLYR